MRLTDPALPAARYLVGPGAVEILRLPVEASGGSIESVRVVGVQYRPGSDVVVRYSAQVRWQGAPAVRETLVAASAVHGTHPGVVPIEAVTHEGPVSVGVWRWPFDPVLTGLADAVTPDRAAELLGIDPRGVALDVVAFRPTERAVVRVRRGPDTIAYVKAVVPPRTDPIARRHRALRAAGAPAPELLAVDAARGVLGMTAIEGPTFRDLVRGADDDPDLVAAWPPVEEIERVTAAIRGTRIAEQGPRSRLTDGILHARMLATVLPSLDRALGELVDDFEAAGPPPVDGVVHGDLHEGQLVVDAGRVVGLLDVDDLGPGATVDDPANLVARLHYRIVTGTGPPAALAEYATSLRDAAVRHHDPRRFDRHAAAALVGLATGPFRMQSDGWSEATAALVERARRMRELS